MTTEPQLDPEERLDLLFRHLGTRRDGLPPREAARRLEQHGPNEIRRREGPGHLRELARQFTHPLAVLLWAAAVLAVAGDLVALAIAIVAVIVLNAVFAFAQELQAERATEALQEFLPPTTRVRRGGGEQEIDATTLVPGDLLLLSEGERLSADARLIEGALEVDMSPLTGESQPVVRSADASHPPDSPLESEDLIINREILTRGWLWLGLVEAALVTGGFFWVLGGAGWSWGDPTGAGSALHNDYLAATAMTFAGITACQVGTAFAARTSRASLRQIGVFSNPLLLWGIAFELAFAAAVIYLPPLQDVFETAGLGVGELAILVVFPVVVWGTDELRRWFLRRRRPQESAS